jgi:hypothetical protein
MSAIACLLLQAAAGAYDPQGVHLDPQGVLRSRTTDPDPRLAALWKNAGKHAADAKLLYVSLPRLFREARRLQEAGKPLPEEIRHLGGLTKLQYVFVHADDVVVAGPAEPLEASSAFRPLGRASGRPALHLDDLVAAMRAFAPGKDPDRLGCDIEFTKEIRDRALAKIKAAGPAARTVGIKKTCDLIGEAAGAQPITYYGVDPDTRFAFVCVEADYRLKQLALGTMPPPVPKLESYRSRVLVPEAEHRFSLESSYEALRVSPDGAAYELRGPSLKINGGLLGDPRSRPEDMSPAGKAFVAACNEVFPALARSLVEWSDLANLGDLSVLAALLLKEGLAERAGWDCSWVLDPAGYASRPVKRPSGAGTLCSVSVTGNSALFIAGGVWIKPAEWVAKRTEAEAISAPSMKPNAGWKR